MILGIMALVAAIGLYASVLGYAIHQYGSIDVYKRQVESVLDDEARRWYQLTHQQRKT